MRRRCCSGAGWSSPALPGRDAGRGIFFALMIGVALVVWAAASMWPDLGMGSAYDGATRALAVLLAGGAAEAASRLLTIQASASGLPVDRGAGRVRALGRARRSAGCCRCRAGCCRSRRSGRWPRRRRRSCSWSTRRRRRIRWRTSDEADRVARPGQLDPPAALGQCTGGTRLFDQGVLAASSRCRRSAIRRSRPSGCRTAVSPGTSSTRGGCAPACRLGDLTFFNAHYASGYGTTAMLCRLQALSAVGLGQ